MKLVFKRMATSLLVASIAITGAGACSSDQKSQAAADEETCLTLPDDQQRAEFGDYVRENGDALRESEGFSDTVCVLERGADGAYSQHYYNRQDNHPDYAMMAFLMPNAAGPLLTYGAISGDLSLSEMMYLSMLTSFNAQGQPYRPYSYYDNGTWSRGTTVIDNRRVTNVYYGRDTKPRSKSDARPANYGASKPLAKASDAVGTVAKDPKTGKPVITKTADTGAKTKVSNAKVVAPPAVKKSAPAPNVPNPAATKSATVPSPAPVPTKSAPSTAPKSKTQQTAPVKPQKQAPKPPAPKSVPKSGK